jgi:predicted transcriptional regulator
VAYTFLNPLISEGLLEFLNLRKKRRRLKVTEKGRVFLEHIKVCEELLPPF